MNDEQADRVLGAKAIMERFNTDDYAEAIRRKKLFEEKQELLKASGLEYKIEDKKPRSKAAIRSNRYYMRKRRKLGKPYIPQTIRILGKEAAKKMGYDEWADHDDGSRNIEVISSNETDPEWVQNLSFQEREQLKTLRTKTIALTNWFKNLTKEQLISLLKG